MIIDGRKLAEELKSEIVQRVVRLNKKLRLAVMQVEKNPVTEKFLAQKKAFGEAVGVNVRVYQLPENISTNALRTKLAEVVHIKQNAGVIVQLPLPQHINTQYILDGIVPKKDPDMLSSQSIGLFATGRSPMMPPVAGAVRYVFEKYHIDVTGKHVVVVGAGRLVGKPLVLWLLQRGCALTVLDEHVSNLGGWTKKADIVISGVGKQGLITKDMVRDGAAVIDCGTAEADGRLAGDIDPAVAAKASFFAPVPGGIGPITIAILFRNIVDLAS